jgi:hypothetical protein
MTRRGLIGALLGAATMDPERLLWVPGAKTISIPKPVVATGNRFLTVDEFTEMWLRQFRLEIDRQAAEDSGFAFLSRYKIGDKIPVRKPARFRG